MWEVALALARAILAEREKREQAAADEQLANDIIKAVRDAIERSTREVLQFLKQQHLDELASKVEGLFVTFIRYSGDPHAEGNHARLREVIDDLALLIPDMGQTIDRINSDQRLAVNTFPIYTSAVALSVLAITERRHRFHVNESFAGILEKAKERSLLVKNALRRQSDLRFHFAVVTEEPGSVVFGYTFEGEFHHVAVVFTGQNPTAAREQVRRVMEPRQESEFLTFPGVQELSAFIDSLDDTMSLRLYRGAIAERDLADLRRIADAAPVRTIYLSQAA